MNDLFNIEKEEEQVEQIMISKENIEEITIFESCDTQEFNENIKVYVDRNGNNLRFTKYGFIVKNNQKLLKTWPKFTDIFRNLTLDLDKPGIRTFSRFDLINPNGKIAFHNFSDQNQVLYNPSKNAIKQIYISYKDKV